MAKGSKLLAALDRHKGVDHKKEHQKKLQKTAEKRKRSKIENEQDGAILEDSITGAEKAVAKESEAISDKKSKKRQKTAPVEEDEEDEGSEGWETDDSEAGRAGMDLSMLDNIDSSEDSDSEEDEGMEDDGGVEVDGEDEEEDIPLSDIESLASEDRGDILPHQRLTINNTTALLKAHKSISLPSNLPFSATQSITTEAPVEIADVEDDLGRELSFYKQSLDAVNRARGLLSKEGISFSRPADYFAEMVKSDEHMGKIKQKLVDEAASKKASAEARKQRDLRKFGKQVQVAKLQERDKAKRDTMDKIGLLKRKRQGADIGNAKEEEMFDVALEDAAVTDRKDKAARKEGGAAAGKGKFKRAKKDEKYGFGGKKRFAKSNDATSSADTRSFSVKKMKSGGPGGKGGKKFRPGKSKRSNA